MNLSSTLLELDQYTQKQWLIRKFSHYIFIIHNSHRTASEKTFKIIKTLVSIKFDY